MKKKLKKIKVCVQYWQVPNMNCKLIKVDYIYSDYTIETEYEIYNPFLYEITLQLLKLY